ncbi:hypothetical protein pb186bvf_006392 [Paramecium bursaria]
MDMQLQFRRLKDYQLFLIIQIKNFSQAYSYGHKPLFILFLPQIKSYQTSDQNISIILRQFRVLNLQYIGQYTQNFA